MKKIRIGTSIGLALGFASVAAGEATELARPSDYTCFITNVGHPDFGPPEGCGDGGQPHSRTVTVTPLSTATLAPSGAAVVVYDWEFYRICDTKPLIGERSS